MKGGEQGANGVNFWVQKQKDASYKWYQLGPRGLVEMAAGDRCVVHTPSGGGWGTPEESPAENGHAAGMSNGNHDTAKAPRAAGSYHNFLAAQAAVS